MSRSDRTDAAMLALPFLLAGLTVAVGHWTDAAHRQPDLATITPGAKRALAGIPPLATAVTPLAPTESAAGPAWPPTIRAGEPSPEVAALPLSAPDQQSAILDPDPPAAADLSAPLESLVAAEPAGRLAARRPDATAVGEPPRAETAWPSIAPPAPVTASRMPSETVLPLAPEEEAASSELPGGVKELAAGLYQCRFDPAPVRAPAPVTWTDGDPESFGLALAAAARRQLGEFVIYNDRYTRLKYPMGDVHPMYGVCTDVVVRAYRALGLDFQELVQTTRSGSGDPNIDHRRVATLRKFFARFGASLPISSFAEDYKPGDIVSYWRPQNRHSRTHIAIVSDMTGPSGRSLIIHNRGWGPQQEDALFVDEITGHYRFSGLKGGAAEQRQAPSQAPRTAAKASHRTPPRPVVKTGLGTSPPPPADHAGTPGKASAEKVSN